jgi:glycosyltransferase involved in cell wall biosynthesis
VQAIPGLRSLVREVQYLNRLVRELPQANTVHHFSASGLNFFLRSAPVLILGRFLQKKIILNHRGGNAPDFLRQWHWCVVPLARLADRIVVPSEFLQGIFRNYGLRATILPNIADTNLFPWQRRRQFAPRLLVTRHLEPIYNVECLLRALRIVQTRFPEAVLTIAGGGSEENRLRDLVCGWGLQGVKFCGPVAHHELRSLYASHDIYVNSSNIDNFPGALVEAACCGLPIVTTRAGGIPQMICNRQNGILVDLNDHVSLATAVVEIAENPVLGQSLARQARLWAEQYSWSKIFPLLLDCYGMATPAAKVHKVGIAQREEARHREFVR